MGPAVNPEIVSAMGGGPFRLVANLPYQAASPLMATLHAANKLPEETVDHLEEEVGFSPGTLPRNTAD